MKEVHRQHWPKRAAHARRNGRRVRTVRTLPAVLRADATRYCRSNTFVVVTGFPSSPMLVNFNVMVLPSAATRYTLVCVRPPRVVLISKDRSSIFLLFASRPWPGSHQ